MSVGSLGRITMVGAGQVGTMLGVALRCAGADDVGLFDADPEIAKRSLALGAGHRTLRGVADALGADTVVLALPVPAIVSFLERSGSGLRSGSFVVDTGSVKGTVVHAMRAYVPQGVRAIGGHPICGTERPGPEGADPDGLRGAPFVLTSVRHDPEALARGRALAEAVGARPVEMDAETHDRMLARTSHLPHVMAFALARVATNAATNGTHLGDVAGSGFRSATRLVGSDPRMVAGFLMANSREVRASIEDFRKALDELAGAMSAGEDAVTDALGAARDALERAR